MSAFTLPADYGYVLGAATVAFFANTFHGFQTGHYRKAAKVEYPNCYATAEQAAKDPNAFKFNCAQRAHANFTENLTPFLGQLFISGLKFPVFSAAAGLLWTVFRVVYARGYVSGGPQGRFNGSVYLICDLALKITSVWTAYSFITAN